LPTKTLENTLHKCTPTLFVFTNVPTQWLPSKYPKFGGGKKKKKKKKKRALIVVRPFRGRTLSQ
jgi:hypothetical protein